MAERSVLFNVELNIKDLEKNSKEASERLKELTDKQKELKASSGTNTVEYAKLSNEIRATSKQLKDNASAIEINERLNKKNTGSLNEQSEALKSAKIAYRNLSEEQRKSPMGEEMQKQIDEMNTALKESESAYGDNQRKVGNYSDALGQVPGATGKATNSIKAMGSSLKALLANPVVLVIAGIVAVLATLYKSFTKTEEGGNKMNKLFSLVGGIVSSLMKAIRPFAEFLVNNLVKAFETVSSGLDKLSQSLASTLDFLGFESMAKGIRDTNSASKELLKTTNDIANREAELVKLRREQMKIQKQAQFDAEKLRQIRDDESLSMEKRFEANEKLGKLLKKQSNDELSIAQKELDLVNKKIQLEGETTELLDKRAEAELQIIDIKERISGQESEQLVNINSLNREILAKTKEFNDNLLALNKNLQDIILDNEDKTNEKQLALIEQKYDSVFRLNENNTDALIELEKQKNAELTDLDLLQKEDDIARLEISLQRDLEANKGNLKIQAELKKAFELDKSKIEIDFANLKTQRDNALIDKEKQHNLDRVANEQKTADELALINAELNLKNSAGLSNEADMFKAFQDEKIRIIRENAEREIELNKLVGQEADKVRAKALLDVKNVESEKFKANEVTTEKELTVQQLKLQKQTTVALNSANQLSGSLFQVVESRLTKELNAVTEGYQNQTDALNQQLEQGVITENEYLTQKANLEKQFQKQSAKIKEEQFKKQKQADLIQSVINTAVGVTQAIPNVPLMVLAGVLGATQTALIASQPTPKFEKGGVFGGNSHANGGTKGYFSDGTQIEVEKDEAFFVLNKKATKKIGALSNLNQSTGGVPLMASGGSVDFNSGMSASVVASKVDNQSNTTNQLLSLIASMPSPIVAVQDINSAQGNLVNVVNFASF